MQVVSVIFHELASIPGVFVINALKFLKRSLAENTGYQTMQKFCCQ